LKEEKRKIHPQPSFIKGRRNKKRENWERMKKGD